MAQYLNFIILKYEISDSCPSHIFRPGKICQKEYLFCTLCPYMFQGVNRTYPMPILDRYELLDKFLHLGLETEYEKVVPSPPVFGNFIKSK